MAKEVIMPKAGMDMQEGIIVRWLVDVGAQVSEGDALLEIETDKVTMELESPTDGVLLCKYFEDGAAVPVVTVIGYVGQAGEAVPEGPSVAGLPSAGAASTSAATSTAAPVATASAQPAAPRAYAYDVAVIGGGPAGYVAAIKVAMLGGKAVLFEKDIVGGTCLNRGCIPTKTYLKTAEQVEQIKEAGKRGIVTDTTSVGVDMPEVYAYKQRVVKKLTGGVAALLKSRGVEQVRGEARLAGRNAVECGGKTYEAASIILCGGSKAGRIPIPGVESAKVLTSDEMLELREVPKRLAVIGGGVIGCELATAFAGFGSAVTVIELMDRLVPMMDKDISAEIEKSLKKRKVGVLTGAQVEKIEETAGGVAVHVAGAQAVEADLVLLSIGRVADLACLGTLADEIRTEKGKIVADNHCRTNIAHIYACGDVTDKSTLAHSAFKMGEAAAACAMGCEEAADLRLTPSCLYTSPEAASVGLHEDEAKATGEVLVGRFPFAANGRALANGEPEGFVKVIADARFGEILGVHIVGANATEMIAEAKVLMDMEITVHEAKNIMHAHPSFAEALMEAGADATKSCIHLPA